MNLQTLAFVVALVLTLIILRILRPRPLGRKALTPANIVLAVLAIMAIVPGLSELQPFGSQALATLALSVMTLALAIGAAWFRGSTVRVWREGSQIMRQGSTVTVIAWILWVVVHFLLDLWISHVSPSEQLATGVMYAGLAVSLAAQGMNIHNRANALGTSTSRK